MRFLRVSIVVLTLAGPMAGAAAAGEWQPQPPKEFVPADSIPAGEQIPAISLVATAYGFVWIAVLGYVWSIARRLKTVESELSTLESRKK